MIDLYYETNIIPYFFRALLLNSNAVESSHDDIADILTTRLKESSLQELQHYLLEIKKLYEGCQYFKFEEREYTFCLLTTVLTHCIQTYKPRCTANAAHYQNDYRFTSSNYMYRFSNNVNHFIKEQIKVELAFQAILDCIMHLEKNLTSMKNAMPDTVYRKEAKMQILNMALENIKSFKESRITLPIFCKKMYRIYDKSNLIAHDSNRGAVLGFFGKLTPLSQLINTFNQTMKDHILHLQKTLLNSAHLDVEPVLKFGIQRTRFSC